MSEERKQWICSTLDVAGGERVQGNPTQLVPMGVAARAKLWPKGKELRVRFLQGSDALHARVLQCASAWLVPGVQLTLRQVAAGDASDLRIAFDEGSGSWSYVGTDCATIRPAQPTMNLGWATLDTPEHDFSSVVIHEFGHALGLLHEHNHPGARIQWDKAAVYADLGGPPNSWDRGTIDSNVFARFDASSVVTTDFDQASVMIYTIPTNWTVDGKSFMPSWKLSEGDKVTIKKLYG